MGTRQDLIGRRLGFRDSLRAVLFGFQHVLAVLTSGEIALFAALVLAQVILPLVFPVLTRMLIDGAFGLSTHGQPGALGRAAGILAAFAAAQLTSALVDLLGSSSRHTTSSLVNDAIEESMIRKCCRLKARHFAEARFIEHFRLINREVAERTGGLITHAVALWIGIGSSVGLAALVFATNWVAGLVSIAAALPAILLYRRQNDLQYAEAYWEMPSYKQMDYALCVLTDREHAPERTFHALKPHLLQRWDAARRWVVDERMRLNATLAGYSLVASVTMTLGFSLCLLIVVLSIFRGSASVGVFALMVSAVQAFHGALNTITRSILDIGNNAKYIHDFQGFLSLEEEGRAGGRAERKRPDISFRNVVFSYPGTDREVLKGITVDIRYGEKVAIVGKNGSGKSTFISLLTGIYEPQRGHVFFGGGEVSACLADARRLTSCIYQDFGRYEMSMADNIRIGDWARNLSDRHVRDIAKRAGIDDLAESLPEKLDTWLGTLGPRGTDLSGGEWQRLAIARVLTRSAARVMILDEPLAALDPKTEARLYERFGSLTGGRTTLLVSHRLGIARVVQRILVFDDGRIVEDGSHDELMARGGLYASLYRSQAQWYL